jgi:hypothetical protein
MATQKKSAPVLSSAVRKSIDELDTTAARIRFLLAAGFEKADVARVLGIKYQWVRNVSLQPVKAKVEVEVGNAADVDSDADDAADDDEDEDAEEAS